mmetsp:Transcript_109048/g.260172  ORF Transcript_109048/g.260172 Transcript_109048/m.260172 type:complete len:236 (-) Transcript_109048:1051-1758(-)
MSRCSGGGGHRGSARLLCELPGHGPIAGLCVPLLCGQRGDELAGDSHPGGHCRGPGSEREESAAEVGDQRAAERRHEGGPAEGRGGGHHVRSGGGEHDCPPEVAERFGRGLLQAQPQPLRRAEGGVFLGQAGQSLPELLERQRESHARRGAREEGRPHGADADARQDLCGSTAQGPSGPGEAVEEATPLEAAPKGPGQAHVPGEGSAYNPQAHALRCCPPGRSRSEQVVSERGAA